jgi:hypothetical protein
MSSHSNAVRFCHSCGILITVRSKTGYCQPCAVSCIAGPRYWQATQSRRQRRQQRLRGHTTGVRKPKTILKGLP